MCRGSNILPLVLFLAMLIVGTGMVVKGQPSTPQFQGFQPVVGAPPNTTASIQPPQNGLLNSSIYSTPAQKRREAEQLISEFQHTNKPVTKTNAPAYDPVANALAIKDFPKALDHLNRMLKGKVHLSVADAYYTVESAYGNAYITRQQYDDAIKESVTFIKEWMLQNGLDTKDNYVLNFAIQKFMSEPLTIHKTISTTDKGEKITTITHQPFHYDYDDYQGQKDIRNSFLTKCIATGFGTCSSMPAVYLVLAEGLGAKAYLTIAPQHSFIKYTDKDGNIINYEPTSNWEISDNWYKDNLFISPQAIATGAYLDTLNSRQIVANDIFDLALEYMHVDRSLNDDFILDCLKSGKAYFPKNNNLEALFIYSLHVKTELRETMRKNGITHIEDVGKSPEAKKLYDEYVANEAYIAKLGYQDIPPGMYEEMLNQHEFKGKIQKQYNINGKEKRNLFNKIEQ